MILQNIANELTQLYSLSDSDFPPIAEFLISQQTYKLLCKQRPSLDPNARESLVLHIEDDALEIGLYISPKILKLIETYDPQTNLNNKNLDAACVAIEGVSHLLYVHQKYMNKTPWSLLELELQAEIDKYILCVNWLKRQGGNGRELLGKLFERYSLLGGMNSSVAWRYQRATTMAQNFCRHIEINFIFKHRLEPARRALKEFYRLSHWQKIRTVSNLS